MKKIPTPKREKASAVKVLAMIVIHVGRRKSWLPAECSSIICTGLSERTFLIKLKRLHCLRAPLTEKWSSIPPRWAGERYTFVNRAANLHVPTGERRRAVDSRCVTIRHKPVPSQEEPGAAFELCARQPFPWWRLLSISLKLWPGFSSWIENSDLTRP